MRNHSPKEAKRKKMKEEKIKELEEKIIRKEEKIKELEEKIIREDRTEFGADLSFERIMRIDKIKTLLPKPKGVFIKRCPICGTRLIESEKYPRYYSCKCGYEYYADGHVCYD